MLSMERLRAPARSHFRAEAHEAKPRSAAPNVPLTQRAERKQS